MDEGDINLIGKNIMELGSGVGLVGVYLAALGMIYKLFCRMQYNNDRHCLNERPLITQH